MINPYEWEEYLLLVTMRNRAYNDGYLLYNVSQEQFFERYFENTQGIAEHNRKINDMSVVRLTEESFETLRPLYEDAYVLGV